MIKAGEKAICVYVAFQVEYLSFLFLIFRNCKEEFLKSLVFYDIIYNNIHES